MIQNDSQKIPRQWLEQIGGFLNYIAQMYTWLRPYLIGLHMTIDGWRPNRDTEGWRLQPKMILVKEKVDMSSQYKGDSQTWIEVSSNPAC
jgi:hypothetical protein